MRAWILTSLLTVTLCVAGCSGSISPSPANESKKPSVYSYGLHYLMLDKTLGDLHAGALYACRVQREGPASTPEQRKFDGNMILLAKGSLSQLMRYRVDGESLIPSGFVAKQSPRDPAPRLIPYRADGRVFAAYEPDDRVFDIDWCRLELDTRRYGGQVTG